jgi:4-hydroxy-2-oxoheptanedioate aldolase
MRPSNLRTIWNSGGTAINGWLSIPSGYAAEVMAHQGWDSLTIDMQHGVIDYAAAVAMLTAISTTATVPVVRVPWLDPGILMKVLDAGAYGVICPMINSRADAQALVAATHYQPRGVRSYGPVRATLYGGPDYLQQADDTVVVFAMIETRQAIDNLDEIMSVPGLDAVYIGPADLSISLGCAPAFDDVEPPVAEAIERILTSAKRYGLIAGIHNGSPESARRRGERGFGFVTVSSDARLMSDGAQRVVKEFKR